MNALHIVIYVNWLKNVNCAILRKKSLDCHDILSIVVTLFLLYRDIVAICHEEDWISLLEVAVNYVATYLFM